MMTQNLPQRAERKDTCTKGLTMKLAITEHLWSVDNLIRLESTRTLQHACHIMKQVKETLCFKSMPTNVLQSRWWL